MPASVGKTAIVTDYDSSLPVAIAEKYGILQAPQAIQFGEDTFESMVEIDDAGVFERINRENRLPTTAAPTPGRWASIYQQAFDAGAERIVCLAVSSKVSATYAAALSAKELLPERDITVIDTLQLSMSQGFMALAAAEAAQAGASPQEIIPLVEDVGQRCHMYAALATLKYLAMSGRVSYLAAGMGTLLSVKPILSIRDGRLDLLEKVRTRQKAWDRIVELCVEKAAGRNIERLAILHVCAETEAREFEKLLRQRFDCPAESYYCSLTPGLSVHAGPGVVGAAFVVTA